MRLSRPEVLVNFNFCRDPFADSSFETADQIRVKRILAMSIQGRGMVSIVGDRGIGKSEAVKAALKHLDATVVLIRPADKERLLISDIEQEMIFALSDEHPRRGKVIRTRQLRRVLGEASRKKEVVVVIEEGHRLHSQTLRSLKTLRELDWMGESKLFSVVLVGQSDPMSKAGVAEVRLRTDCVQMHGLLGSEIKRYIRVTVGTCFSDQAIETLAKKTRSANFLDLHQLLVDCMARAMAAGREMVEIEDLQDENGRTGSVAEKGSKAKSLTEPQGGGSGQMDAAVKSVLSRRQGGDAAEPVAAVG